MNSSPRLSLLLLPCATFRELRKNPARALLQRQHRHPARPWYSRPRISAAAAGTRSHVTDWVRRAIMRLTTGFRPSRSASAGTRRASDAWSAGKMSLAATPLSGVDAVWQDTRTRSLRGKRIALIFSCAGQRRHRGCGDALPSAPGALCTEFLRPSGTLTPRRPPRTCQRAIVYGPAIARATSSRR